MWFKKHNMQLFAMNISVSGSEPYQNPVAWIEHSSPYKGKNIRSIKIIRSSKKFDISGNAAVLPK